MKATRHAKILELIQSHTVTTQEELQSLLESSGFFTTQATISRDIRELRLVKVLSPSGIYYYTQNSAAFGALGIYAHPPFGGSSRKSRSDKDPSRNGLRRL